MTPAELAAKLDGREYGSEITKHEELQAKKAGLIIVFGASDDLIEFRGVVNDEAGCYDGGTILFTRDKILPSHDECDCQYCGYKEVAAKANKIEAKWSEGGYSWLIETDVSHAAFDIMEDGEKYCRGVVISVNDIPAGYLR